MTKRPSARRPGESRWIGWLYLTPGLLIYLLFVLYPIAETIRTSFYRWDGFSMARRFIGLANYQALLADTQFRNALANNLIFILFYTILPIGIGLGLTALLSRRPIPGLPFFRTGFFLPQVLSMVVVGVTWRWIYNPVFGPLNRLLKAVGLAALARPWLGDFTWALPAVGLIGTWVQYGFCMVLFMAGVQRIPLELYEAARIDGAGGWQEFRYITLPALRPELGVAAVTTLIAALRVFDLVFVTTRGGPGEQTLVTALLIYRSAFELNQVGYAATMATVLTAVIAAISFGILRLQTESEVSEL